ncbi:uncharacterized protein MELLADRAFT_78032 [Melampsora larici-populina 98AG31]|uniref:Uncharacterized protein n=1 Tax=Melampsora larici-populina (strain 98AG31 / pathotype 3-4-7) TaxID=747676 RepID=F4RPI6_MELLP|nr:uncharacterized protein MELLADRAFT_78032 [Melampsora larici-populina 98AG31]EGG05536.1 hypothetical protein MELLADRAFT_78032 [Melampsora larici-populina 98AG31]
MSQSSSTVKLPEIPDFDNLTANSAWQWLSCFMGWHIPALSEPSKKITLKTFNDLPRRKNRIERYAKGHQLWVPESELRWLKIFKGSRSKLEVQNIQYPIGLRLVTTHPPRLDHPHADTNNINHHQTGLTSKPTTFGEMKTICFDGKRAKTNAGYWPLSLGHKMKLGQSGDFVQFDNLQSQLGGIKLPKVELGWIWIETGIWGPRKRILFKKLCSDESIGILIWPQLPGETSYKTAKPTPRIPVYEGDTVELADNDRILVFVGKPRGMNSAVLQINVTYQWVGCLAGSNMAETKYSYPNPCERYPHCLRRPIYSPIQSDEPEILEHAHFPITESPDLADRFNEAKQGDSSDFFNETYSKAQESVLKDLRNGVIPEIVEKFMENHPSSLAVEMMSKFNPALKSVLLKLNSIPEYTIEFPPELESTESPETDEYIIEELNDLEDTPIIDTSRPSIVLDTTISATPNPAPQPGPSCLKRTSTSSNLKRAHQKEKDELTPRDLKRRRSVTFAKQSDHDVKGKGRMIDSSSIEDLEDEPDHEPSTSVRPEPPNLSDSEESEESEAEFESTPRNSKRPRSSLPINETPSSQPIESCLNPSASMENLSNQIDWSRIDSSQGSTQQPDNEKGSGPRRSTRRRSSGRSEVFKDYTSLDLKDSRSVELEGSDCEDYQKDVNQKSVKRKRKSWIEDS